MNFGHREALSFSNSVLVLPLDLTTLCKFYAWNYSDFATLLIPSERLAEGGFEPLTGVLMCKNLFSFKPEEWSKWIRRFERFRLELNKKDEESQVNTLI